MINTKPLKFTPILFLLFHLIAGSLLASNNNDNDPTIIIHDTIVAPGELLLQVDALNFINDNGQVAAITLRIEIDTLLLQFINIQNTTIAGSWLGNYNIFQNEITITYTAPFGTGIDINGKLLDLNLSYNGGFPANLHLKSGCEISNVNLITIQNIVYEDGIINQIEAVGTVSQDTAVGYYNQSFEMPIMAEGVGYDKVNQINLRINYDTNNLEYEGYTGSALTNITVEYSNSVLTIDWEDDASSVDLTTLDTLMYLQFNFIGDTNSTIAFLPGSKVYNSNVLVASDFVDGIVNAKLIVELVNNPDTAGVSTGGGYYFINDLVTVTAIPEGGFNFLNWTKNGNIVSNDSEYSFVKQSSHDTLIANYEANSYMLSVIIYPVDGGEVIGAGSYLYGESVELIAVPAQGYVFEHWMFGGDIISEDSIYIFVMPANNMELIAVFNIMVLNITVSSNNLDFGTAEGGGEFNYGETSTVIATPFPQFKFVAWTENGELVSSNSLYTFTVFSNRNLIANFQYNSDCSSPVSLYVDNLSETDAMLNWLPSGNENEWELLWGETGFDTINSGEFVEGLMEPYYLLEMLDPGTNYDFYVRAVCSDQIQSTWAGPHTFSTWFVGMEPYNIIKPIVVFPNPANNKLNFVINESSNGKLSYKIINLVGSIEMDGVLHGQNRFTVNVESLPSGVYIIQLFKNDMVAAEYFVKK